MSKEKTHAESFDEVFKVLLVIVSLTFSSSIAFYRDVMEPKFFAYSVAMFIGTVVWSASTLYGGKYEYFWKIIAWWFLMSSFGSVFARMYFTVFLLPPLIVSVMVTVSLVLTLPMLKYLRNVIGEKDYRSLKWTFIVATLGLVLLDVLYFLGLFIPSG